jgi:hypothetical protein
MEKKGNIADDCPVCGHYPSYTGGHCSKCGTARPASKRNEEAETSDLVDYFNMSLGERLRRWRNRH